MTDQQRADFFASEGFPADTMPFIDALSQTGARFRRAYTPMPTCTPARTSMLAGRYPKATRIKQNFAPGDHVQFAADLRQVLKSQGYSFNLCGKNHSYLSSADFDFLGGPYSHTHGPAERATPLEAQADQWLWDLDHTVAAGPTPFPLETQLCARIVTDAIACVEAQQDNPFFLWLSLPEPHNPYQAPEPYFSLFDPKNMPERIGSPETTAARGGHWEWLRALFEEKRPDYDADWRRYRAVYAGMIRMLDDQIARFAAHLQARGLWEKTVFIFLSDHGDYAGDHGLQRKGAGLPECLTRVPLLIHGPGIRAQDDAEHFVSLVDIMPTLCEATGAEIPFGVQGRSLWPMLTGAPWPAREFDSIYAELGIGGPGYPQDARPELHFPYPGPVIDELNAVTQSGNLKMARAGEWKILMDEAGRGELYHLASDPGELDNLYDRPEHLTKQAQMLQLLLSWSIRTEDNLPKIKYLPHSVPHGWLWAAH